MLKAKYRVGDELVVISSGEGGLLWKQGEILTVTRINVNIERVRYYDDNNDAHVGFGINERYVELKAVVNSPLYKALK